MTPGQLIALVRPKISTTLTWQIGTLPTGFYPRDGTFGNGRFVYVGETVSNTPNAIYSSNLGATWSFATTPPPLAPPLSVNMECIASNGTSFVAFSDQISSYYVTSSDGDIWVETYDTLFNGNPSGSLTVDYANGLYHLCRSAASNGLYSSSTGLGSSWTHLTIPGGIPNLQWRELTFGNGVYVAISPGDLATLMYNGTTFTNGGALAYPARHIAFGNGVFVVSMRHLGTTTMYTSTSTNGAVWTSPTMIVTPAVDGQLVFDGTKFYLFNAFTNIVRTSVDGITWAISGNLGLSAPEFLSVATDGAGHVTVLNEGSTQYAYLG